MTREMPMLTPQEAFDRSQTDPQYLMSAEEIAELGWEGIRAYLVLLMEDPTQREAIADWLMGAYSPYFVDILKLLKEEPKT